MFVAEGARELVAALETGRRPEAVLCSPQAWDDETSRSVLDAASCAGSRVFELEDGVIERISDTVTPQPLLGIVGFLDVALEDLRGSTLLVVCAEVRDPGNAGTILRTADAAGAGGVVFCDRTVDLYNPKTVRASAGALFHVPVAAGGPAKEVLGRLGEWGMARLGAVSSGGVDYAAADLNQRAAIVLGNEAVGLPESLSAQIDQRVSVPMHGQLDSLNVGIAAAVLCFEAERQRRHRGQRVQLAGAGDARDLRLPG